MRAVLSASRRTDIPAFYMRWLEHHVQKGFVDVRNPVVKERTYRVSLRPEDVHTIVLWSKNFRPFLDSPLSRSNQFRWYFNFSLVDCPEWEPGVLPLPERKKQIAELCERWSPRHINWRFDPIVYWDNGDKNNLVGFPALCDFMAEKGVRRCTFSFVTWYNKIKIRLKETSLKFYDPSLNQKLDALGWMAEMAKARNIALESCCNDALLKVEGIARGRCIHSALLSELAGEPCSQARDSSQRKDCGCTKSSDIGGYQMSCPHGCLYCYAKPVSPRKTDPIPKSIV